LKRLFTLITYSSEALKEMVRQVGNETFDKHGIMNKGVNVRHLSLPGYFQDAKNIIRYLYDTFGDTIYINLMNQFTQLSVVVKYPELNRRVTDEE